MDQFIQIAVILNRLIQMEKLSVIYEKHRNRSILKTGFLISSNAVLTAAHNIQAMLVETKPRKMVFYPGVSGSLDPADGHRVIDGRLAKEDLSLVQGDPTSYDYAQLRIECFSEQPQDHQSANHRDIGVIQVHLKGKTVILRSRSGKQIFVNKQHTRMNKKHDQPSADYLLSNIENYHYLKQTLEGQHND